MQRESVHTPLLAHVPQLDQLVTPARENLRESRHIEVRGRKRERPWCSPLTCEPSSLTRIARTLSLCPRNLHCFAPDLGSHTRMNCKCVSMKRERKQFKKSNELVL